MAMHAMISGVGAKRAQWHLQGIVDARTYFRQKSWSYREKSGKEPGEIPHIELTAHYPGYHAAEVQLAIDVFHGDSEVWEFEAKSRKPLNTPYFILKPFGLYLGRPFNSSYVNGMTGPPLEQWELRFDHPWERDQGAFMIANLQPRSVHHRLWVEFLRADGKISSSQLDGYYHPAVLYKNRQLKLPEIEKVRVTYNDKAVRLLVNLPSLPGVPPENAGITDLWDVTVPYVEFEDIRQWFWFLVNMSHENGSGGTFKEYPPQAGYKYPMAFQDMTLRQLAEEFQVVHPQIRIFQGTFDRYDLYFHDTATGPYVKPKMHSTWWDIQVYQTKKRLGLVP